MLVRRPDEVQTNTQWKNDRGKQRRARVPACGENVFGLATYWLARNGFWFVLARFGSFLQIGPHHYPRATSVLAVLLPTVRLTIAGHVVFVG
ncbi:MAG: hypothetical protein ACJ74Y_06950 [Bryobacteraceae bacterium]